MSNSPPQDAGAALLPPSPKVVETESSASSSSQVQLPPAHPPLNGLSSLAAREQRVRTNRENLPVMARALRRDRPHMNMKPVRRAAGYYKEGESSPFDPALPPSVPPPSPSLLSTAPSPVSCGDITFLLIYLYVL